MGPEPGIRDDDMPVASSMAMASLLSFRVGRAGRRSSRPPRLEGEAARMGSLIFRQAIGGGLRSGRPVHWRPQRCREAHRGALRYWRAAPRARRSCPAHASARRDIQRVLAQALDGRNAQRVDRRLGENQPRKRWTLRGQAEERFGSPCQRTFVGRSAHIDMGDNAVTIEMGGLGAAARPLPQNAGRRGGPNDRGGEPSLSREIPPGRRIGPNSLSLGPAFWWKARRQSCEFAQALADVAEAQAWIEPLHQSEDVTFGVARRIPPAASAMADDKDFAFASPVLQAESRVR